MSNISHKVFQVKERGQDKKPFWLEVGIGFTNKDGSLSLMLDSIPLSGKLQVRPFEKNKDN